MADDLMPQTLVDALLPGLGFFGGTEDFALKLDVGKELDRILIEVDAGKPEILNISAIRLYGIDGKEMDRRSVVKSVCLSSIYEDYTKDEVTSRVIEGKLIHTHRENKPFMYIELSSGILISKIVIYNRNDFYGCRSRCLVVKGLLEDSCEFCYINDDSEKKYDEFLNIASKLKLTHVDLEDAAVSGDVEKLRGIALQKLESKMSDLTIKQLCYFLPVYSEKVFTKKFEMRIISHILFRILESREHVSTSSLNPFSRVLGRDADIEGVSVELNLLDGYNGGNANYIISKHLIQRNKLLDDRKRYVLAIEEVIEKLRGMGIKSVICYGTLLGAVREGGFLAHDDDVDVLYIDGSRNPEESIEKKKTLISKLKSAGYSVRGVADNFHVGVNGVIVDVFPCWIYEGKATLLMEYFKYRDVPASILTPPSTVELYGHAFPAPADPEEFLRERYGEGWSISDPFHEWPWKVERSSAPRKVSGQAQQS